MQCAASASELLPFLGVSQLNLEPYVTVSNICTTGSIYTDIV